MLEIDSRLSVDAQSHASEMCYYDRLSHDGFPERLRAAGFAGPFVAEVVARGQTSAEEVVREWLTDPPPAQLLLGSHFTLVGVGRAGDYWCLTLGGH